MLCIVAKDADMKQVIVIDTETTGFEAASNSLVEFAAVWNGGEEWFSSLVKPEHRISYGAMATHHITEDMVVDAPGAGEVLGRMVGVEGVLVAHNAEFDRGFVRDGCGSGREWICTWRCAMHIWPEAESHSNQSLRYELGLDVSGLPLEAGGMAHRALYDAWITHKLLERMLTEGYSVDRLVELTTEPVLQRKVRFGKHAGMQWSEVPKDYLRWVLRQDFDRDVLHTAEFHLR